MNATELGLNPYRNHGEKAMEMGGRSQIDPRANGLDGDVLDQLLKGRWQEGHETGNADGRRAAAMQYPEIFDEAFARGHAAGIAEAGARMASALFPVLQNAGAAFSVIGPKTNSQTIKEICARNEAHIRHTLENVIGTYATEAEAGVDEQGGQPA